MSSNLLDRGAGAAEQQNMESLDKMSMSKSVNSGDIRVTQPAVVKQTTKLHRHILARTKTEKNNHLSLNNKFDAVGSNGLFSASPSMVKFAWYELNKTHTLKVKLVNNSPAP